MLTQTESFSIVTEATDKELEAVKHFEEKRWGSMPQCPYCGSVSLSKRRKDLRFKCLTCKKSGSVTVNTHLHGTRLPLHIWQRAFVQTAYIGKVPTAAHLQKDLNISYKSALRMHNKISELMEHGVDTILQTSTLDTLLGNAMKQLAHHHQHENVMVAL